jgi:aryl-alcohol dehydrogenase-like predicted oxidoreductase
MQYRTLGKTGFKVSGISLGTWQVGGRWGEPFNEQTAAQTVDRAVEHGINFFDTADVYSDGLSERAVAGAVRSHKDRGLHIATKCGRYINPHVSAGYTPEVLQSFVEASLENMQTDCIDLIQLHCPPTEVYYRPEIFALFDKLADQGKIRFLGVSVEKVEEALKAIEYPNVTTVQIIFNMFRHRPAELFFKEAKKRGVGIIVRVPLASGLLSGKITAQTTFGKEDHRQFNRKGEAFDKGETFSGVDFSTGLKAVEELKALFPEDSSLAQWALRWILMFPEVSCVIPGASRPEQIEQNVKAAELPPLTAEQISGVKKIYDEYIKDPVHYLW